MARQNLAVLLGAVLDPPNIIKTDDGKMQYGFVSINVVRADRDVGDQVNYMRQDTIPLITRNPAVLREMASWQPYDIVDVKGVLSQAVIGKTSWCPECGSKNTTPGDLVYVNPIFAMRRAHCESKDACKEYLAAWREVSNQIFLFGVVCQKPRFVKTTTGIQYLQFPIAMNRRFRIKEDPADKKADYIWVKAYGKNWTQPLEEDLQIGSEIYIIGCLQLRNVRRHRTCGQAYQNGKPMTLHGSPYIPNDPEKGTPCGCGQVYDWRDQTLEAVPYQGGIEYLFQVGRKTQAKEEEETDPNMLDGREDWND